jgi:acyl-CoA reductase-like NAD-dependent aldehyde dehydrogenase
MLKGSNAILEHNVRFNMEADSLNYSMLGPDALPGMLEFDLFIKEVVREMTTKAGQKCTAIRRTLVPEAMLEDVIAALKKRLSTVTWRSGRRRCSHNARRARSGRRGAQERRRHRQVRQLYPARR